MKRLFGVAAATVVLAVAVIALLLLPAPLTAQKDTGINPIDREARLDMLWTLRDAVKKNYYDPKFHGVDIDAQYRIAQQRIEQAKTLGQATAFLASFLDSLHDSHTFLIPPQQSVRVFYGYRMQMIGDNCYITRLRPGSDAARQLQIGDLVVALDSFRVDRASFRKIDYFLRDLSLQPQSTFVLQDPNGKVRKVTVASKVLPGEVVTDLAGKGANYELGRRIRQIEGQQERASGRWMELGNGMVWKMPDFLVGNSVIDDAMGHARKANALVLDLRGNPGGTINALKRLVGCLFDKDVTIGNPIGRKKMPPVVAKTPRGGVFHGKLVVLVDSDSASAAELFARVIQLGRRGTVVGDRTSGYVMAALLYPFSVGADTSTYYGASITHADLVMADGKDLEGTGVTPDEIALPTGQDLAAGRDPAMARALALVGVKMDPVAAGKLFPYQWTPETE